MIIKFFISLFSHGTSSKKKTDKIMKILRIYDSELFQINKCSVKFGNKLISFAV